jgi:5-methyltetrahydropteroyltriglutamate--homocysteine methyltransferase
MKRSSDRILTTHTGSLPRPPEMVDLLAAADRGEPPSPEAFAEATRNAVRASVEQQIEAGIDIVNDGEQGKPSYATYVKDRLSGFDGESSVSLVRGEARDFPEWAERRTLSAASVI